MTEASVAPYSVRCARAHAISDLAISAAPLGSIYGARIFMARKIVDWLQQNYRKDAVA